MRRSFTLRKLLVVGGVVVLLAATPVAVLAARGVFGGELERQSAVWTTTAATTSGTAWVNVPGLALTRCSDNQVTAMVSVTVSGCPAASAGPRPSTNTVPPSAVTSLVVGSCGDAIVSPATFSTPTVTCSKAAGHRCSSVQVLLP